MTVFKGFLSITKRNLGMMLLYIIIFLTISIFAQKMLDPADASGFKAEQLDIAVIDRDGGALAKGLTDYLGLFHNLKDLPDDKSILQDRLFYRDIYYIVTIPEDFEEACLSGSEKLSVTKVPGSTTGYYVDQQINTFLNSVRTMTAGGFSVSDAVARAAEYASSPPDVTLIDKTGHGGSMAQHAFMFQYMPYIMLSILCYTLSFIMIAFGKPDVKKRTLCSCISARSMNLQLIAGHAVVGLGIFAICTVMPAILYGRSFLSDPHLPYYLLNSFIMMLVSLSIAFLISSFPINEEIINGIVNVITLGMAFTCGVFVSMDILGKGVRTIARFLPVYWYETTNSLIAGNRTFTDSQTAELWRGYGIQLLFMAAFFGIALVLRRNRAIAER